MAKISTNNIAKTEESIVEQVKNEIENIAYMFRNDCFDIVFTEFNVVYESDLFPIGYEINVSKL